MNEQCHKCPLNGCKRVSSFGPSRSPMVIGEAPGKTEAAQGRPFVGESGRILRGTISKVGINPEMVYYTNACMCHPPNNDTPPTEAVMACRPRLIDEIRRVKPTKILTVGAVSAQALDGLNSAPTMKYIWGLAKYSELAGCNVVHSYHPAACIRSDTYFPAFGYAVWKWANQGMSRAVHPPAPTFDVVDDWGRAVMLIERIGKTDQDIWVSADIETTGKVFANNSILCLGLATDPNPFDKDVIILPRRIFESKQCRAVMNTLRDLFNKPNVHVTNHGIKYDAKFLAMWGVFFKWDFDTLLASYLLNEHGGFHDLKQISRVYLNALPYADKITEEFKEERASQIPPDELHQYNAYDCVYALRLTHYFRKRLEEDGLMSVMNDLLLPADHALWRVELNGMNVDKEYVMDVGMRLKEEGDQQEAALKEQAKEHGIEDLNPRSPKQVGEMLYDKLGVKEHAKKGRTTDQKALAELEDVPFWDDLKEYRATQKLLSTYIENLLTLPVFGRYYPSFKLHGTSSGRLSETMHNVPIRKGPIIRDAFIARLGHVLMQADYSQLEMRMAAEISNDPNLLEDFMSDVDIHTLTASRLFNVPVEEVTSKQRYLAKTVNFGTLYGSTAGNLVRTAKKDYDMEMSDRDAQHFIDVFFGRYFRLKEWLEAQLPLARSQSYLQTIFGRRRRFLLVTNQTLHHQSGQAKNFTIQSTASDICLRSLIRLVDSKTGLKAQYIFSQHDSILADVEESCVPEQAIHMKSVMEDVSIPHRIPFPVEIKVGPRWGSLKTIDV